MEKANRTLEQIQNWMEENSLQLATHKTEAIILKGKPKRDDVLVEIGRVHIRPKKHLKYLGIHLSGYGYYGEHITKTTERAEGKMAALSKIMPNIGGPGYEKRRVLCEVVQLILLYGAPVWYETTKIKKYKDMLLKSQRKALISHKRIQDGIHGGGASGGGSTTDSLASTGKERNLRTRRRAKKKEVEREKLRQKTIDRWQEEWQNSEKGKWTQKLIPNLKRWMKCPHRRINYFITQAFTGHGTFGTYTQKIQKCSRWNTERTEVQNKVGRLDSDTMVEKMLEDKKTWDIVSAYIENLMKTKEGEDRENDNE